MNIIKLSKSLRFINTNCHKPPKSLTQIKSKNSHQFTFKSFSLTQHKSTNSPSFDSNLFYNPIRFNSFGKMSSTEKLSDDFETLKALSSKELKNILIERGIDHSDCLEKSELLNRVIETKGQAKKVSRKEKVIGGVLEWGEKIAGLECAGLEMPNVDGNYQLVVIVCHGFGANKEDLIPIAREMLTNTKFPFKIQFIFPDAPNSLGGSSRAWWDINVQEMMMKGMTGKFEEIFDSDFEGGVQKSRAKINALITEMKQRTNLPTSKFVLAGFSQGSMLMTDVALNLDETPGGLVVFSGILINKKELAAKAEGRKGMKVLQCHGTQDPVLPFMGGTFLRDWFKNTVQADSEFVSFQGGHSIDYQGINKFKDLLLRVGKAQSL